MENRRTFLKKLCLSTGSVFIIPACSTNISFWRFFTEDEANLVIGIAEQFIPADKDPGATDANVINYIDKQLMGPLKRFQEDYHKGLHALNQVCNAINNKDFLQLKWDEQTEFLEKMEAGILPTEHWSESDQKAFFRLILSHSMQGFYGSPRHGGNCNYVSYKMMKIDYPHVIGQNRYKEEDLISNQKAL